MTYKSINYFIVVMKIYIQFSWYLMQYLDIEKIVLYLWIEQLICYILGEGSATQEFYSRFKFKFSFSFRYFYIFLDKDLSVKSTMTVSTMSPPAIVLKNILCLMALSRYTYKIMLTSFREIFARRSYSDSIFGEDPDKNVNSWYILP